MPGSIRVLAFEFFDERPESLQLCFEYSGFLLEVASLCRDISRSSRFLPANGPLPGRSSRGPEAVAPPLSAAETALPTPVAASRKTSWVRGTSAEAEATSGERSISHRSSTISSRHGPTLLSARLVPRGASTFNLLVVRRAFTYHCHTTARAPFVQTRGARLVGNPLATLRANAETTATQPATFSAAASAASTGSSACLHSLASSLAPSLASALFWHDPPPLK